MIDLICTRLLSEHIQEVMGKGNKIRQKNNHQMLFSISIEF